MTDAAASGSLPLPTVIEPPEEVTAKLNSSMVKVPEIEIKLFVGRVPHTIDEEQLRSLFSLFGTVTDVMIMKDKGISAHKGAAFVRLSSIAHADAAIRALNNVWTLDESLGPLQVRYAVGEAEKLNMPLEAAPPGVNAAKLFVGSLPKNITEAEVRDLFSHFGIVDEVYIMKDPGTNTGKGCAFVKMAYKEQAHLAVARLNGSQPLPNTTRSLEVRFAESKKATTNHAPVARGRYGSNDNPRSAGGWKEYFTSEGRPYYYNEKTGATQWPQPLEFERLSNVHPSSRISQDDIAGPPGANIFVFHVPNDWSREDLIEVFQPFGYILSARIATDKVTQRNKGYAFVSYDNIQSAVEAVKQMDGYQAAANKKLKVAIKQNEEGHVAHIMTSSTSPAKQTMMQF